MSSLRTLTLTVLRIAALLLLLQLPALPARATAAISLPGVDLLHTAAARLEHQRPAEVARWLRRHRSRVRSASVGSDGKSVEFRLRSGITMAILPSSTGAVRQSAYRNLRSPMDPGSGRKALVLAPFEDEMGVKEHVDSLVSQLRAYGLTVKLLTNTDVTVDDMVDLSRYDVVYDITHSGVSQYGDVDIATGQPVDPRNVDPALMPFIQAGSLMVTGVSGTTTDYYGIRSAWIQQELDGQFPAHSLLYLDGCSALRATLLWQALQQRGVSTFVSWDNLAVTGDDGPSADAFFGGLTGGSTVDASLAALLAKGLGVSWWAGTQAHLGYLGDGTLTLDGRSSQTPTPYPTATSTPAPNGTPTPPPTVTLSPTPVPTLAGLLLKVHLRGTVREGARQTVRVLTEPGARVRIHVAYPWGGSRNAVRRADAAGRAGVTYTQPSPPGRSVSHAVRVTVDVHAANRSATSTRTYRIANAKKP